MQRQFEEKRRVAKAQYSNKGGRPKKNNGRSKGPAVGGQVEEIEEPEGIFVRQGETS